MTAATDSNDQVLFNFDEPGVASAWRCVNDGVMGGISEGRFEITDEGTLRFYGKISLENNGGFASLRSAPQERDLSKYEGVLVRIRGDGKRYAFSIRTDFEIMAGAYRHKFDTAKDTWQQVFLPFDSFQAASFGRVLADAPRLKAEKIRSLGLTISDKQAGPFQIHVDWIKAAAPGVFDERLVTAGCATCIFEMDDVTGCKLAVEIDGRHYLVEGSDIDDHGDAHAEDGLCSTTREAVVSGKIEAGLFLSTHIQVLPK